VEMMGSKCRVSGETRNQKRTAATTCHLEQTTVLVCNKLYGDWAQTLDYCNQRELLRVYYTCGEKLSGSQQTSDEPHSTTPSFYGLPNPTTP
jgi:hypothetical protein